MYLLFSVKFGCLLKMKEGKKGGVKWAQNKEIVLVFVYSVYHCIPFPFGPTNPAKKLFTFRASL